LITAGWREALVRAAELLWHVRVAAGHAFEMGLVDDCLVQRPVGRLVAEPVEMWVMNYRLEHVRGAVLDVDSARVVQVVAVTGGVPVDVAFDRARVRIQQQFSWIAADAFAGLIRAMDAIAVALSWFNVRQVRVPREGVDLLQADPALRT